MSVSSEVTRLNAAKAELRSKMTAAGYDVDDERLDALVASLDFSVFVPKTRKINGKDLSADRTLTGADIAVSASDSTKLNTALAGKAGTAAATSSAAGLMPAADKVKADGMAMVTFGTCTTAAAEQVKTVSLSNSNWQLKTGSIIGVKYSYTNTYNATADAPCQLNVNATGAKNIYFGTSATPTGTNTTAFGYAKRIIFYMFDGTNWVFLGFSSELNDNTIPSAYCSTAAATAAKAASCTNYVLLAKSYLHIVVRYSNTSATALTLNVNTRGAKPVYINGTASSTSNYTLPAGSYLVYYDGTAYHFRTDGKIPGDISGNAGTATKLAAAKTIQTDLASTAAASFDGSANVTPGVKGILPVANGGTGASTAAAALTALGAAPAGFGLGTTAHSVTNLNDCTGSGLYMISKTNANTNHGINSALVVLHIKYSATYSAQLALAISTNALYYRRYASSWQAWQKVTMAAI